MDFDPQVFANVPVGSVEQTVCSPEIASDHLGVVIVGPTTVFRAAGEETILPVCGTYQLSAYDAAQTDATVFELRSHASGDVQAFDVLPGDTDLNEPDFPEPDDAPQVSEDALRNTLVSGFLNMDLQAHVPFPIPDGTYDLRLIYGGATSNVITFSIVPE